MSCSFSFSRRLKLFHLCIVFYCFSLLLLILFTVSFLSILIFRNMSAWGFGVNCLFKKEAISLINPALIKMVVCPVSCAKTKSDTFEIFCWVNCFKVQCLLTLESATFASTSSSRGTFIFPFLQKNVYKHFP